MGKKNISELCRGGVKKINERKAIVNKFNKFCATKRACRLVKDIDFLPVEELMRKYDLQYLRKLGPSHKIKRYLKMATSHRNIVDYTRITNDDYKTDNIITTMPKNLTKDEIRDIWARKPKAVLGHDERLHMLEEYKTSKWEKKNPAPTQEQMSQDLFPIMLMKAWEHKKEEAITRIRNMIIATYYKLTLMGRYQINDDSYTDYNIPIATIKDKHYEFHDDWNPECTSKSILFHKATKIVSAEKRANPNLIAAMLIGPTRKEGRIILPKAA